MNENFVISILNSLGKKDEYVNCIIKGWWSCISIIGYQ